MIEYLFALQLLVHSLLLRKVWLSANTLNCLILILKGYILNHIFFLALQLTSLSFHFFILYQFNLLFYYWETFCAWMIRTSYLCCFLSLFFFSLSFFPFLEFHVWVHYIPKFKANVIQCLFFIFCFIFYFIFLCPRRPNIYFSQLFVMILKF